MAPMTLNKFRERYRVLPQPTSIVGISKAEECSGPGVSPCSYCVCVQRERERVLIAIPKSNI